MNKKENLQDKAEARRASARKYAEQRSKADFSVTIPRIKNKNRREECGKSLQLFLKTYFPIEFSLPFSTDQLEQLELAQKVIQSGGKQVIAAPRADGKTSRTARSAIFALLYNYRKFLVILAADESKAENLLEIIKNELLYNDLLAQDFPEICAPIRSASGNRQRVRRLRYKNKLLGIEWSLNELRLPFIEGKWSACGQVIRTAGLTASIRGLISAGLDGTTCRPDLVLCDDVQTDSSARSAAQTGEREGLLCGAVAGLAGPLTEIALFGLVTVIRKNDLAERLLDKTIHPEYSGRKYKLVYEFGENKDLWEEYNSLWRDHGKEKATDFYIKNRSELDKGWKLGWEYRVRKGEISAIQTAQNLKLEHGISFSAEYQNEPDSHVIGGYDLNEDDVTNHLSSYPCGVCPENSILVAGIDVNLYGLSWSVIAVLPDASSYVIDYGKFPSGDSPLWVQGSTLTEEQAIYAGILALVKSLSEKNYKNTAGEIVYLTAIGVDSGYKKDVIFSAVKQAKQVYKTTILPVRGFSGLTYSPRGNLRKGDGWHVAYFSGLPCLCLNVDIWRTRAQQGWLVPVGAIGSISVYTGVNHRTYAQHVCGERIVEVLSSNKGMSYYKWSILPNSRQDYLDSLVYSLALTCYTGISFSPASPKPINTAPKPDPIFKPQKKSFVTGGLGGSFNLGKGRGSFIKPW